MWFEANSFVREMGLRCCPRAFAVRASTMAITMTPAERRTAKKMLVHIASSSPSQFSSFHGAKMVLPECFVHRGER